MDKESFNQHFTARIYPTAKDAENAITKALQTLHKDETKQWNGYLGGLYGSNSYVRIEEYNAFSILIITISFDSGNPYTLGIALDYLLSHNFIPQQYQKLTDLHTEIELLQDQVAHELYRKEYGHMSHCRIKGCQYDEELKMIDAEVQRRLKLINAQSTTDVELIKCRNENEEGH